ncbi:growth/differentiation factor 10b isoform X2 [Sphaeramia orbicularis]|uniref:growth/differentiation factor 10b isoform X2 n=1 Tax=Sphaeramia orbicularis TaxID=375764 RepID=UPI00117FB2EF|nr:interferon gamma receptor 1 isoform X2 [Sphaeramia orbicularis]
MNMAWNIIQRVFLLGFFTQTGLARVLTPTNVTLQCHNFNNVLRWNYDQLTPGLKFKVIVRSENSKPVELWVDSPTLHIDLSSFSDPADGYYVTVSAVMGDDESPSAGMKYNYYENANVNKKCTVDFPAVNVTVTEDKVVHFRFIHPWLFYNADPKPKKKLPTFDYDVQVINQTNDSHHFDCWKKVCEEKIIPVDNSQEIYCVHLHGTVEKISVQPTQEYCSSSAEQPSEPPPIFIVIGVLGLILIIIITVMVCMKKIRPPTSITVPEILKFNGPKKEQLVPEKDQDQTCVVHVEPVSSTHLLSTPDANDSTLVDAPSIESEFRLPIRALTKDSEVSDQAEAIQEDVEESGYKQGNDLDEDSSQNLNFSGGDTGYEKRSTLE